MNDDWFDLLAALQDAGARFLIVGAHALAAHGIPRATHDLDVWIDPTTNNAARVWQALAAFGAPTDGRAFTVDDLSRPDLVIQVGVPPNRIDLLTSISGVPSFAEGWNGRVEHAVRERLMPLLGRAQLVTTKRASARRKDLADLEALGEEP